MALTVPAHAERSLQMPVSRARAWELLLDIPLWAALFPRVDAVVEMEAPAADLADGEMDLGAWRWTMEPMGPPGLEMRTEYGCAYTAHPPAKGDDAYRLVWTPVDGVGNARFGGAAFLVETGAGVCELTLTIDAELTIPAPRLLRGVVETAVAFEFRRTLDTFLERVAAQLASDAG